MTNEKFQMANGKSPASCSCLLPSAFCLTGPLGRAVVKLALHFPAADVELAAGPAAETGSVGVAIA